MEIQDIKKVQDAIYQRLKAGGVDITREELSVDGATLDKCKSAASLMVGAMEAQNSFNTDYSDVSIRLEAGLEVDEKEIKAYTRSKEDCQQAIKEYSDAHILAHRTEYAAQLARYRAADSSTLKKLSAYRYDRDAVDAVIANSAKKEWKQKHPEIQGKNCLLVGKNAIADGIDQLIDSNTHSPIPIKGAVSAKVKVPYGEPMYPMLNPNVTQDNNDLRPANEKVQETKAKQQEIQAQQVQQQETEQEKQRNTIKRFTREYNDEPTPNRRRTLIAADLLYEERVKRGVRLSPDPAPDKQKAKGMDMGQDLDNILRLNANNGGSSD